VPWSERTLSLETKSGSEPRPRPPSAPSPADPVSVQDMANDAPDLIPTDKPVLDLQLTAAEMKVTWTALDQRGSLLCR
jgi:hypothetical protein